MKIMRALSAWLYGVPEDDVKGEVDRIEARVRQRERNRKRTADDSVAQLSREMRELREGRR